jgi:hypothetical protein
MSFAGSKFPEKAIYEKDMQIAKKLYENNEYTKDDTFYFVAMSLIQLSYKEKVPRYVEELCRNAEIIGYIFFKKY